MTHTFIFLLGTIVGSFLNVVIFRLEKGESIVKKRSHCPKCGHVLTWYELIPVISFIVQRRRCRACRAFISWQYPLVEMGTALLFLLIFNFQFLISNEFLISEFLNTIYYMVIASLLIVISVFDLKHYIIPDKIIYPAVAVAFIYRVTENSGALYESLASALVSSLLFASIFVVSRGKWLGFGDVKLVFFMGLFLGWPDILVALFFAFILGGIIGVGLIVAGRKTLKSQVPFGPFLIAGTFIAMFWGEKVAVWYMDLLKYPF